MDYCRLAAGLSYTNLLTYSEQFDHASWIKTAASVTPDIINSPFDELTADKLTENAFTSVHRAYKAATTSSGVSVTFSIYAKAGERSEIHIRETIDYAGAIFDLLAGTVLSGSNASITDEGDGWFRCFATWTTSDVSAVCQIALSKAGSTVYLGTSLEGAYIYGAQIVEDVIPGSYVLTTSTTATDGCTATETGDSKCFNTRSTCNSAVDYTKDTKEYKFCQPRSSLPRGENMFPVISGSIMKSGTSTTAGSGLGKRAVLKAKLKDFPHHDRGIDPYISERSYNALERGTFFGKFLKRNPYYEGRTLKIYYGYIGDSFSFDDFEIQEYDIIDIAGISNGHIDITAKDVLIRTHSRKSQYPEASEGKLLTDIIEQPIINTGTLAANITAAQTTAVLSPSGIGDTEYPESGIILINSEDILFYRLGDNLTIERAQFGTTATTHSLGDLVQVYDTKAKLTDNIEANDKYPSSGTISIGKEAMLYTRTDDELTLVRNQWGTKRESHSPYNTVQICASWNGDNIIDVLNELLVNGSGLPASYIPTSEWEAEKDLWLSSANVKGILLKPESIEKVIAELSESFMFDIWWDATSQTVKIKALSPEPSGVTINTLTEGANIIKGSVKIDRKSKNRYTEIRVFYNKSDYSEDNKTENFKSVQISSDISRASSDRYDGNSIKTIISRWFEDAANAAQLTGRLLARFNDTPEIVTFKIDNKDHGKLEMAGRVELNSWQFQDATGANESRKFQVLEIDESDAGHELMIKCLTSSFSGRYFFIAPNGTPDYSSATEEQKEKYGFICLNTGLFADGNEGYKII